LIPSAFGQKDTKSSTATYHGYDNSNLAIIRHTPLSIGDLYELSFWASGGSQPFNLLQVSIEMMGGGSLTENFLLPGNYPSGENLVPDWQVFPLTSSPWMKR
jgi:hypothetical protein